MDRIFIDKKNGFPYYTTSLQDIEDTQTAFDKLFTHGNMLNGNSVYDKRDSKFAGVLGEIVFKKLYPEYTKELDDLSFDFGFNGSKIDVKCKLRNVPPRKDYEASFFVYQSTSKFNADTYYFMSTTPKFELVWLCGFISKEDMLQHPNKELWLAGDVDTKNNMKFRKDTVCLKYMYLNKVDLNKLPKEF